MRDYSTFQIIAGFGFLFFGLDFMNLVSTSWPSQIDLSKFCKLWKFCNSTVGLGFLLPSCQSACYIVIALSNA